MGIFLSEGGGSIPYIGGVEWEVIEDEPATGGVQVLSSGLLAQGVYRFTGFAYGGNTTPGGIYLMGYGNYSSLSAGSNSKWTELTRGAQGFRSGSTPLAGYSGGIILPESTTVKDIVEYEMFLDTIHLGSPNSRWWGSFTGSDRSISNDRTKVNFVGGTGTVVDRFGLYFPGYLVNGKIRVEKMI